MSPPRAKTVSRSRSQARLPGFDSGISPPQHKPGMDSAYRKQRRKREQKRGQQACDETLNRRDPVHWTPIRN